MAEWTTEKEFDRPSTDNKNGVVNVQVNVPNLAKRFNVSEKTIRRELYVLRDLNLIQFVGSDKTGHWEVII